VLRAALARFANVTTTRKDLMSPKKCAANAAKTAAAIACFLGFGAVPTLGHSQAAPPPPEEIVVTSSLIPTPRREIGTAVSVLEGAEIELRGFDALADALRTQPGIGVSNSGGPGKATTLRIRGEEGYRTMLVIDGVKAVDSSALQVAPSFDSLLATSDMERVEVLRGPQGFLYGADAGGVVNVLTVRGSGSVNGQVGFEGGDFATRKVSGNLAGGSDRGDFYVSATDLDTDGFNARASDTVLRDDDGAENTTLHAKVGFNVTENARLQLVARDVDASTLYDGCFTSSFSPSDNCIGTTDQMTYKLSAELRGDRFTNAFGYSNIDIKRDNLTDGISAFKTEGEVGRIEYTGSFRSSDALTLVYGVDLQNEEVVTFDTQTLDRDQDGYYAEYQGAFHDRFFVTLGARYDDNEDFGTHTSARGTVAYAQDLGGDKSLKYRASYGTGFRPPSLFEISYNERPFGVYPPAVATPLKEETSRGYDIGVEYTGPTGLRLEATYFDQDIEDAIVYVFDPITFDDGYVQSLGTSTSEGVELGAYVPIGARWAVLANWTNNDTETMEGQPRLQRPKNLGNFGAEFTSENRAFRFIANYRLSRDAIDFGGAKLDDYEVLDLSAAYSFKVVELYGRVENATDEHYSEVTGYNTAGRAAYAGVRLRF
jgi:vitamin B12 transporter